VLALRFGLNHGGRREARRKEDQEREQIEPGMICSDLYMRRMLLGNGDDGRRCRDAHIEGKTIEESQVFHPESWLHKIQPYQVPLIPSSRGHNYAMTYLRLIPGTPSQVRPTPNNKQQYSAQAIPDLRWHKQHCPISPRSFPLQDRAPTFIPSRDAFLFVPLFLCPPRHALGTASSAFRTRFPPRSSRRDKGVSDRDRNVAG